MIKMFASDIDNTLFSHKTSSIAQQNFPAAQKLADQDVTLVLATARIYPGVREIAQQMKMKERGGWIISSAGAEVIDCATSERYVINSIPMEQIVKLKAFADAHDNIVFAAQQEDFMVADGFDASLEFDRSTIGIDFLVVGSDFFSFIKKPVCIASLTGSVQELDEIEEIAREQLDGVSMVRSEPRFLDILPKGVNKAETLKWLCRRQKMTLNELAAMGDGNNDLEMLQEAGYSLAPSNASQKVRQSVDRVVCSCDEGAFAEAVELILKRNGE